jgi:hypothetical protein
MCASVDTFSLLPRTSDCGYARGMQVSKEDLKEFRMLYAKEFGEELSDEEASEMAGRVAGLYSLLAEPLPSEQGSTAMRPYEETGPPSLG